MIIFNNVKNMMMSDSGGYSPVDRLGSDTVCAPLQLSDTTGNVATLATALPAWPLEDLNTGHQYISAQSANLREIPGTEANI